MKLKFIFVLLISLLFAGCVVSVPSLGGGVAKKATIQDINKAERELQRQINNIFVVGKNEADTFKNKAVRNIHSYIARVDKYLVEQDSLDQKNAQNIQLVKNAEKYFEMVLNKDFIVTNNPKKDINYYSTVQNIYAVIFMRQLYANLQMFDKEKITIKKTEKFLSYLKSIQHPSDVVGNDLVQTAKFNLKFGSTVSDSYSNYLLAKNNLNIYKRDYLKFVQAVDNRIAKKVYNRYSNYSWNALMTMMAETTRKKQIQEVDTIMVGTDNLELSIKNFIKENDFYSRFFRIPNETYYGKLAETAYYSGAKSYGVNLAEKYKKFVTKANFNSFDKKFAIIAMDKIIEDNKGNYKKVLEKYNEIETLSLDNNRQSMKQSPDYLSKIAVLNEKIGNYNEALKLAKESIHYQEKYRENSKTKESYYTMSDKSRPYKTSIRSSYEIFKQNKSAKSFTDLISSTEMLRSRSLKDNKDYSKSFNLEKTQNKLSEDEVILGFQDLENYYLGYYITKKEYGAYKISNITEINSLINRDIRPSLATASSDLKSLENNLITLSKSLLKPIEKVLNSKKTYYFLADGQLNYIPFDILTLDEKKYQPLILKASSYSQPTIFSIKNTNKKSKTNKSLLVYADPVYANKRSDVTYPQLPETYKDEAVGISKYFKNNKIYNGKNVNSRNIINKNLSTYSYIHFATHGILDNEDPRVNEPALVLSRKNSKVDTYLKLSDIQKLKLNADLTVLSACNTGSGLYSTGEGVSGLGQAFIKAGSKNVVMSLWQVPSKETVMLMTKMYQYINNGKSPSDALRLAKLNLIQNSKSTKIYKSNRGLKLKNLPVSGNKSSTTSHPFYWSSFIISGS